MEGILSKALALEVEFSTVVDELHKAQQELQDQLLRDREPLLKRRSELVAGRAQPSAKETEGFDGSSTSAAVEAPAPRGVPFFWLSVLCNQDLVAEHISPRDKLALEYLEDVRCKHGTHGVVVELVFAPNPFFNNKVLRRGISIEREPGGGSPVLHEDCSGIDWKEGRNLTLREVAKKGGKARKGRRDEGGAGGTGKKRYKACASFFRLFSPILQNHQNSGAHDPLAALLQADVSEDWESGGEAAGEGGGKLDAAQEARALQHSDILAVLAEQVVARAVHLYLSGPLQGPASSTGSEPGGSEEDEDGEGGYQLVSGEAAGSPEALPLPVRRMLHALQHLQQQIDEQAAAAKQRDLAASQQALVRLNSICQQRSALLSCQEGSPAIPHFWRLALRGLDSVVQIVTARDARALRHLVDVSWRWDEASEVDGVKHYSGTLELKFRENPFFSNAVLRKRYTYQKLPSSLGAGLAIVTSEADPVAWCEGRDLTVRRGPGGRPRPAASFFCLFKKGAARHAFNITGDDRESQAEAVDAEAELLAELLNDLMPGAAQLYQQVCQGLACDSASDDEEGSAEEEEEEEEEEGQREGEEQLSERQSSEEKQQGIGHDNDEAALRRAARRARSAPRLTKAHMLIGLITIMMLAEVLLFLDSAAFWRRLLPSSSSSSS